MGFTYDSPTPNALPMTRRSARTTCLPANLRIDYDCRNLPEPEESNARPARPAKRTRRTTCTRGRNICTEQGAIPQRLDDAWVSQDEHDDLLTRFDLLEENENSRDSVYSVDSLPFYEFDEDDLWLDKDEIVMDLHNKRLKVDKINSQDHNPKQDHNDEVVVDLHNKRLEADKINSQDHNPKQDHKDEVVVDLHNKRLEVDTINSQDYNPKQDHKDPLWCDETQEVAAPGMRITKSSRGIRSLTITTMGIGERFGYTQTQHGQPQPFYTNCLCKK